MQIREIMTTPVISVSPDHNIRHAVEMMLEYGISGLPVIDDDGRLVGIVTESDLLARSEIARSQNFTLDPATYINSHSWRVGDLMSSPVQTISESTSISEAADMMRQNNIRRLPVVSDGKLIGIVSRTNLLVAFLGLGREKVALGDDALCLAIKTRLGNDLGIKINQFQVSANDGEVLMTGYVESEDARLAAGLIAEEIDSTKFVNNQLTVL